MRDWKFLSIKNLGSLALIILLFGILVSGCKATPITVTPPTITVTPPTVTSNVTSTVTVTVSPVAITKTVTATPTKSVPPTSSPVATQNQTPISLTDKQLLQAYNQNKLAAESSYKGKLLQITGTVKTIDSNPVVYVSFQDSVDSYNVRCFFQNQPTMQLLALTKGQTIVVQGVWNDYGFLSLDMNNCVLVSASQPSPQSVPTITIAYSSSTVKQIGTGSYPNKPKAGNVFLVIDMTIENKGYDEFNTNPNYFKIVIDNIQYDYSWYSSYLDNALPDVDILNNGKLSGRLAFEVPSGTTDFTPSYVRSYSDFNVEWVKK